MAFDYSVDYLKNIQRPMILRRDQLLEKDPQHHTSEIKELNSQINEINLAVTVLEGSTKFIDFTRKVALTIDAFESTFRMFKREAQNLI